MMKVKALGLARAVMLVSGVALFLLTATNSWAIPAVTFDNTTGQALGNPSFTLGWQFRTDQSIVVT